VAGGEGSVFRPGGISYLRIPAVDAQAAAAFYSSVFGWRARRSGGPSVEDATGHVIGHFVDDQAVAGEGGVRPYITTRRSRVGTRPRVFRSIIWLTP